MRMVAAVSTMALVLIGATPLAAQENDGSGFGALVGGLVGGAVDAAISGRAPRAADLIPGHPGGERGVKGQAHGMPHALEGGHGAARGGHDGAQIHHPHQK